MAAAKTAFAAEFGRRGRRENRGITAHSEGSFHQLPLLA